MKHIRLLLICILAACIALATQAWAQQSAPTDVQAAPGNKSAAVSFQAPAADNGGSISGYTVASHPSGGIDSNSGSPSLIHVVTGLTDGIAYTFTVTATNSSNETSQPSSASNSVTPSSSAYAAYAGTWNVSYTMTGADSPFGNKCVQQVNADGTFTSNCTDNYDVTGSSSCSAWLFPYGLTATCTPSLPLSNLVCYGAPSGSVSVCTATIVDGTGSTYLSVGVREGSGYSSSDLVGTWNAQDLDISSGEDGWMEGDTSISSNGNISGSITSSNSSTPMTMSGVMSLSSSGLMSCTSGDCGGSSFFMDAGKNVAAGFGKFSTDDVQLMVLSKKASSYTLADLAGYWAGDELSSAGTWDRVILEVNGDGSYIDSVVGSDGSHDTGTGNLSISKTGVVSCSGGICSSASSMVMDAGKNVMTSTETDNRTSRERSPFYSIHVFTKTPSLWPNAVDFSGGWMGLEWLGNFNVNSAPWIYHQTLGWLYPYGTSTGSIWFYDPQWDGTGGWWWTSSSLFPWIYSVTESEWLYFDAADSTPGARWFFTGGGQASTH